jgi:hypothetical protein
MFSRDSGIEGNCMSWSQAAEYNMTTTPIHCEIKAATMSSQSHPLFLHSAPQAIDILLTGIHSAKSR